MTDPTNPPPAEPAGSEDDAAADPAPADPPQPPPVATAGRALKLVVTLHPGEAGQRALLALGADGCDPVLRSCTTDGLLGALEAVPALLAEAEARWRDQPRNPSAAKPRPIARRDAVPAARPAAAETSAASGQSGASPAPPRTGPAPGRPPPTGQLPLFG